MSKPGNWQFRDWNSLGQERTGEDAGKKAFKKIFAKGFLLCHTHDLWENTQDMPRALITSVKSFIGGGGLSLFGKTHSVLFHVLQWSTANSFEHLVTNQKSEENWGGGGNRYLNFDNSRAWKSAHVQDELTLPFGVPVWTLKKQTSSACFLHSSVWIRTKVTVKGTDWLMPVIYYCYYYH